MRATLDAISAWITAPPLWPKAVISGMAATAIVAWSAVWAGRLGHDWALWATSSGVVVAAITTGIWREMPHGLPKPTPPESPRPRAGPSDIDREEDRVRA